ncbi:MAG: TylF/MycF/NovP-related O-methyltransferase [Candidatus Hodarchaeota archaeon]
MRNISNYLKKKIIEHLKQSAKKKLILRIANDTEFDLNTIKNLINRFETIQTNIPCAHNEFEFFLMYIMLLKLPIEGPIVELGCYKGGSSAKLSLICELTNRTLFIFDSFEGLPLPNSEDELHRVVPWTKNRKEKKYKKGDYSGSIKEVKRNISNYGCIEVCKFKKGLFKDTLPVFNEKPASILMDVDLIASAYTVLKYLWPKLLSGGIFFTHEACDIDLVNAITDYSWWEKNLYQKPPLLYGAGYGISWRWYDFSFPSNLAYLKKD